MHGSATPVVSEKHEARSGSTVVRCTTLHHARARARAYVARAYVALARSAHLSNKSMEKRSPVHRDAVIRLESGDVAENPSAARAIYARRSEA